MLDRYLDIQTYDISQYASGTMHQTKYWHCADEGEKNSLTMFVNDCRFFVNDCRISPLRRTNMEIRLILIVVRNATPVPMRCHTPQVRNFGSKSTKFLISIEKFVPFCHCTP